MSKISINLQEDPEIPAGRRVFEHLVGAHMSARDVDELVAMVCYSIEEILSGQTEHSLRVLTHAVYRGQALVIDLLNLATAQHLALSEMGVDMAESIRHRESERFGPARLELWHQLQDDSRC